MCQPLLLTGEVFLTVGLDKDFSCLITTSYDNIKSTVQVSSYMSAPIKIECSVRQGCFLPQLLYVLTLKTFLRMSESFGCIHNRLECGLCASVYTDGVNIAVTNEALTASEEKALKYYETSMVKQIITTSESIPRVGIIQYHRILNIRPNYFV